MKKIAFIIAFVALLSVSCKQEAEIFNQPDIAAFQADRFGGEFETMLFTNGTWTATCEDDCVTITPASGVYSTPIHIKVDRNYEHHTKDIKVVINSQLDTKTFVSTIVVTQESAPFVECVDNMKTVGEEGGDVYFYVNSNFPWHVESVYLDDAPADSNLVIDPAAWDVNGVNVKIRVPACGRPAEYGKSSLYIVTLALDDFPDEEKAHLYINVPSSYYIVAESDK